MVGPLNRTPGSSDPGLHNSTPRGPSRRTALGLILGAPLLGACAGGPVSNPFAAPQPDGPAGPQQQPLAVGTGQVKVGLVLPLSASGNAGVAAQSMKNAAEMALAEFQNPNIQLLIKDDGGSPQGAQQVTQQALGEGAEIILGPLFAGSVPATAQLDAREGRPGDRVLDRFERRRARRLSPELPAGVRRQPDRRLLRQHRQEIFRGAAARQCLWQRGGGGVQAGRRPQGAHRRLREIRRRPSGGGADGGAVARRGRRAVHRRRWRFGGGVGGCPDRGGRELAQHPVARHRPVGQSARDRKPGAAGRALCRAGSFRLPQFRRPLSRQVWRRAGAHRDAGL